MTDWRARALACEQQAEDEPQDRPEALMETAWAWGKAGEHQRGLALLEEAPLWEDALDRGLARTARADLHAELGDQHAVRDEYALLWSEGRTGADIGEERTRTSSSSSSRGPGPSLASSWPSERRLMR